MIVCKDCGKANSLDSRFCRVCGSPLPAETLVAEQTANAELLAEGRKMLEVGRLDEARLAAQRSLEANPSEPDAWALLGDCRDRAGETSQALEAYERVVELRPDNPLDRVRLQHLRNVLEAKSLEPPPGPARGPALLAAGAAVVLVACLGAAFALVNAQRAPQLAEERPTANQPTSTLPSAPLVPAVGGQAEAPGVRGGAVQPDPQGQPSPNPALSARGDVPPVRQSPDGTLPLPTLSGGVVTLGGDRPLSVMPPPIATVTPERTPPPASSADAEQEQDPDPTVERPAPPERPPPGRIEIRPSPGQPQAQGGTQPISDNPADNRAQALSQTARELFRLGNYAQAADAYEKAVAAGANDGATLQRLAQSYERLGRNTEAIGAYERAIRAFESALRGGDSARARAGLEASRQAVRVLQGA